MAVVDLRTLSAAKTYTDESLLGGGAIKGANAVIAQIKRGATENEVVFEWTLADGSKQTDSIIVKNGKDGKDGIDGIDGEKGDKGDPGDKGIGIESITKKSSAGLVDTYLIVFTDGTESSFDVVNGANITKTSQLENDSNFITNVVNNLLNYYTKDEVYTKANIDELLRNVGAGLSVKIVTVLPTEEISGTTIYLIKTSGNNYNQYMWIDNAWANLGSTTVDLSNYYTKDKVEEILLGYVTKDVLASILIDYVKKSELAKVATSNDYNDLNNLPQIPDVSGIKPYTNVLQDSENTAPTSKALYDAVSGINSEVEKKAKSSDVGNISELSTTDKSSVVAAINGVNNSLVGIESELADKADKAELNAKLGGLSDSINSFKNFQIVSSLGSVKLKEIIQSEFPKIKNDRGMIKISDGTTLYCGTYIKYSNTQGSATFTNVEGTSYIWTILGDTVTLQEIATMDKVVPQVIIENKTTDDARTIIQNSWGAFPTNNSLARIETSVFTWSVQIYKHDSSWGTIILTCYADNKDSYIGKLSDKVWHWYKMGLTEV